MLAPRLLGAAFVFATLLAGVSPTPVRSDEATTYARVAPILEKHCNGCHGPTKSKGDLRLDKLDPDLIKGKDGDRWREVLDRLNVGDMPPPKSPAMPKEDLELLTNWLVQERRKAALAKNPPTHFRRLTRREYERTLQDLLGLPIEFGNRLPEDGKSKNGFRNDGDALRMSPLQYETGRCREGRREIGRDRPTVGGFVGQRPVGEGPRIPEGPAQEAQTREHRGRLTRHPATSADQRHRRAE